MGRQFLAWFGAALLGGVVLWLAGGYWQHHDWPPEVRAWLSHSGGSVLDPGDSVPADLALPDLDGTLQPLAQWRGRPLLLNFWATWCQPCRRELPLLAAAQKRYGAARIRIVGVAMDDPVAVRAFLKHTPLGYPVLVGSAADRDPAMRFGDRQGLLPFSVLIDARGRVTATHLGALDAQQLRDWLK